MPKTLKDVEVRLVLEALEDKFERIGFNSNFGADLIHGFGNMIWRVASDVLSDSPTKQLASRLFHLPRQALGLVEYLVRN